MSSYNAMNKVISKEIFKKKNILTPNFFTLKKNASKKYLLKKSLFKKKIKFPVVVKPINEGSSIGVKIAKNMKSLQKSVSYLFKKYNELILEQYIGGQEIQAAVLNNAPIGAIELIPKRSFYDYKS